MPVSRDRRTYNPVSERVNMPKTPSNSGKVWTPAQSTQLKTLAQHNTPTRVIGLKMQRSPASVQNQAGKLHISLKPTNQSPYGTKKK